MDARREARQGGGTCSAVADHHVAQALAHVRQRGRQRQDGHDLRGHRDVKARLPADPQSSHPAWPAAVCAQPSCLCSMRTAGSAMQFMHDASMARTSKVQ